MRIIIEDSIHCERIGDCDSFEEAIEKLEELANLPWDEEPNRAPCKEWRSCGRKYKVSEYDTSTSTPWVALRVAEVLEVSASGFDWTPGFEEAWAEPCEE